MRALEYVRLRLRARRVSRQGDAAEIAWLTRTLRPGTTVLDVGAHKGAYTWWLRRAVGASGRVVAFEPQPLLVHRLREVAAPWPNVRVEWLALSSRNGELELHIPKGGPSPVATLEPRAGADFDNVTVPVTTLDDYAAVHDIGSVGFIKVDVEGHELEFFRGAEQLLRRDRPLLLFECEARHRSDGVAPVFEWLLALGYTGSFFHGSTLRPLTEFDPAVHQVPGGRPYCNNFVFSA
jgi:FkbM family methyltransferase